MTLQEWSREVRMADRGRGPERPAGKGRRKMTPELAREWVAYVVRKPVEWVDRFGLTDEQLVELGGRLASHPLLNPPRGRSVPEVKTGVFRCECGCGELFTAKYRTTKPRFKSDAHRMRWWRAKWRREGR